MRPSLLLLRAAYRLLADQLLPGHRLEVPASATRLQLAIAQDHIKVGAQETAVLQAAQRDTTAQVMVLGVGQEEMRGDIGELRQQVAQLAADVQRARQQDEFGQAGIEAVQAQQGAQLGELRKQQQQSVLAEKRLALQLEGVQHEHAVLVGDVEQLQACHNGLAQEVDNQGVTQQQQAVDIGRQHTRLQGVQREQQKLAQNLDWGQEGLLGVQHVTGVLADQMDELQCQSFLVQVPMQAGNRSAEADDTLAGGDKTAHPTPQRRPLGENNTGGQPATPADQHMHPSMRRASKQLGTRGMGASTALFREPAAAAAGQKAPPAAGGLAQQYAFPPV